ncbi:aminotransferase class V-fold PLP-dependent enzyme [Phaeacidiphilus oryzae]|uniref:aminotransferase class V-fold PLP-dependent enzyme n=1 Tax=Phaeacidiphilus oryzae TaxID=348818 RepID=UPI000561B9FD|nr:aminotransferase class V-fold PLP-dependent enzyme [Phaeacidiphilus oryzae]
MSTAVPATVPTEGRPATGGWPLDPEVLHLNHGSFGTSPTAVLDHQRRLREEMDADPDAWFRALPERVAEARRSVAEWLGAPEPTAALVPNASAGATAVAAALPFGPGDRVLVTDHAYGAVEMGVRRHAARAGATVETVALPIDADAEQITALLRAAMDDGPRPALLVVDQITSATALLLPVERIAADCRERGVPLLVDGAHAPGMLADPLTGLQGAYWIGNLHKWPCAPRGTAVLVADPAEPDDRQRLFPPIDSWGAPDPYPRRFDQQGTQDLSAWLTAPHALRTIEAEYGWAAVREHNASLAEEAQALVAEHWGVALDGVPVLPAPAMRLVPLPAGVAADQAAAHTMQRLLAERHGVAAAVTTWRGRGFVRLSAHLYNRTADYQAFAERCRDTLLG